VTRFDDELRRLAADMHAAMAAAKGVGLAAPQVGISARILVLNPSGKPEDALTLVNPVLSLDEGSESGEEGCLSFPGIYAEVERAATLRVDAQDLTGGTIRRELSGFVARIVQHEFDHLEGVLFVDRFSSADKLRARKHLRALEERFKEKLPATKSR
jgi:peptide deformylase